MRTYWIIYEVTPTPYGEQKRLANLYNRSVEEQTCVVIAHETMHYILDMEQGLHTSRQFDNIAEYINLK